MNIGARRRGPAASVLIAALASAACSSSSALKFRCDASQINGGLLLTVDVVRATEAQARQIEALGEKWFYDPLRDSLRDRTTTVTFQVGANSVRCERDVAVKAEGKDRYLVIIADYKYQSADASRQLLTLTPDRWKGKTLEVAVRERELSVGGR